jgi:hypothetical protein
MPNMRCHVKKADVLMIHVDLVLSDKLHVNAFI